MNTENEVFATIISMCSARILRRLRFVANRRSTPRQPIKEVLQNAVDSIKQLGQKKRKRFPATTPFIEKAKEIVRLVDA